MAESADKYLRAIETVYRRWLTGEVSQEDALFEIGDLLARAETGAAPPKPAAKPRSDR